MKLRRPTRRETLAEARRRARVNRDEAAVYDARGLERVLAAIVTAVREGRERDAAVALSSSWRNSYHLGQAVALERLAGWLEAKTAEESQR